MSRNLAVRILWFAARFVLCVLLVYFLSLGLQRFEELHPEIHQYASRIGIPLVAAGLFIFYGVRCARAFRQGMMDAK
jgi:hypothetical protein